MIDFDMLIPILGPFVAGTIVTILIMKIKGDDIVREVH